MSEHPSAGEVWSARYRRAWDRVGVWTENPLHGDRKYYAAEQRRLWGELGERLGIGPPPDDLLA